MSDYFENQNKAVDVPEDVTKSPDYQDGNALSSEEQSTNGSDDSLDQIETTQTDNKSDTDKNVTDGDKQQEQKLYTKDELDATAAKIKAIYEKKGRKAAERELAARFANQQQPPNVQIQSQALNVPPAPDNSSFWDPTLQRWLPNHITALEYADLANQLLSQANPIQNQNYTQNYTQNYAQNNTQNTQNFQANAEKNIFTENAENQAIECSVELKDFETVMKGAPITPVMANAACLDKSGMKNLYEMMKESPHELYQISQISDPIEQQNRMWLMNQKFAQKRAKKVQTKATVQPAPLDTNGKINKPWSEMSYLEKKRAREKDIWR